MKAPPPVPVSQQPAAVSRARPAPLAPMRLGAWAQTGLVALRVLLGLSTVMALFTAFHAAAG